MNHGGRCVDCKPRCDGCVQKRCKSCGGVKASRCECADETERRKHWATAALLASARDEVAYWIAIHEADRVERRELTARAEQSEKSLDAARRGHEATKAELAVVTSARLRARDELEAERRAHEGTRAQLEAVRAELDSMFKPVPTRAELAELTRRCTCGRRLGPEDPEVCIVCLERARAGRGEDVLSPESGTWWHQSAWGAASRRGLRRRGLRLIPTPDHPSSPGSKTTPFPPGSGLQGENSMKAAQSKVGDTQCEGEDLTRHPQAEGENQGDRTGYETGSAKPVPTTTGAEPSDRGPDSAKSSGESGTGVQGESAGASAPGERRFEIGHALGKLLRPLAESEQDKAAIARLERFEGGEADLRLAAALLYEAGESANARELLQHLAEVDAAELGVAIAIDHAREARRRAAEARAEPSDEELADVPPATVARDFRELPGSSRSLREHAQALEDSLTPHEREVLDRVYGPRLAGERPLRVYGAADSRELTADESLVEAVRLFVKDGDLGPLARELDRIPDQAARGRLREAIEASKQRISAGGLGHASRNGLRARGQALGVLGTSPLAGEATVRDTMLSASRAVAEAMHTLGRAAAMLDERSEPVLARWVRQSAEKLHEANELAGRVAIIDGMPDTAGESQSLSFHIRTPWGDLHEEAQLLRRHGMFVLLAVPYCSAPSWWSLATYEPVDLHDPNGPRAGWTLEIRKDGGK